MAWTYSPNLYASWWNRQPVDVSHEPTTTAEKPNGEPRTGQQRQYGQASVAFSFLANCPPAPPGDYPIWRAMDHDPALVMSRAVITAPIREAEVSFEAREGTPDERVEAVQDAILPLWPALIREALDALSMGWKPFEVVSGRRGGLTVPIDVKPLAQELTAWLHRGGKYSGLRNTPGSQRIDLLPEQSLYVTCGGHNRDPYGIPWHENARDTWWRKIQCINDLARLRKKGSGIQGKIWYPPAEDEGTAHTNEEAARKTLNAYMAGDGAVLPNATGGLTADTAADYRNIQGLAEAGLWKLEVEDFGSIGADHAAVLAEIAACNADLSRAWHVPERAAQEGEHGTKAEAETHGDIALSVSQLLFNDICAAVTQQVVDVMLVQNWGEAARGSVALKAGMIRDVFAEGDWKLIDKVMADADLFAALVEQLDVDAVFTRRRFPKNKGILTLVKAIQEKKVRREEERQAKQAQTELKPEPVNGERMKMIAAARGVAMLGRILGDGHDE